MAKIVLGARPKQFKRLVKVPMLDGTEGLIEATYKYRTLTEFGVLMDELTAAAKAKFEAEKAAQEAAQKKAEAAGETCVAPEFTFEDNRRKQAQAHADYLVHVLDGWNLDEPFSEKALLQLCDEVPAAAVELSAAYKDAITEGRLGN